MSNYTCPKCNSTNTHLSQGTPPHALRWDCNLFGFDASCFCIGERLIAKEAIAKRLDRFSYEKTIILYSSTECVVLEMNQVYVQLNDLSNEGQVFRHELRTSQPINAYRLIIKTDLDEVYEICIIDKLHFVTQKQKNPICEIDRVSCRILESRP